MQLDLLFNFAKLELRIFWFCLFDLNQSIDQWNLCQLLQYLFGGKKYNLSFFFSGLFQCNRLIHTTRYEAKNEKVNIYWDENRNAVAFLRGSRGHGWGAARDCWTWAMQVSSHFLILFVVSPGLGRLKRLLITKTKRQQQIAKEIEKLGAFLKDKEDKLERRIEARRSAWKKKFELKNWTAAFSLEKERNQAGMDSAWYTGDPKEDWRTRGGDPGEKLIIDGLRYWGERIPLTNLPLEVCCRYFVPGFSGKASFTPVSL